MSSWGQLIRTVMPKLSDTLKTIRNETLALWKMTYKTRRLDESKFFELAMKLGMRQKKIFSESSLFGWFYFFCFCFFSLFCYFDLIHSHLNCLFLQCISKTDDRMCIRISNGNLCAYCGFHSIRYIHMIKLFLFDDQTL